MTGDRRAIEDPLWVDFSDRPVPPLSFFLQTEYSPTGVVRRPSDGVIASQSPWYSEVALTLTGTDGVAVLYLMSKDDESSFLMACLDEAVEPFFNLLTDADYGDGLTRLMAMHWPEVYAMLLHSNERAAQARVLCNVATPGRVQWVVADQLRESQVERITREQVLDLIDTSLQTLVRVTNPMDELPDLFDVYSGPDRMTRRLRLAEGLLGATSGIGQTLQGGVRPDELRDLGLAALEAVRSMIKFKD